MTDAEKIAMLREALVPFADLLDDKSDLLTYEADISFAVYVPDIAQAKEALRLLD